FCLHLFLLSFPFPATLTTYIYTLSLHDALPILTGNSLWRAFGWRTAREVAGGASWRGLVMSGFFSRIRSCCSWVFGPCMNASVQDRKSTRLNSSHVAISYAVFCLKKKKKKNNKN